MSNKYIILELLKADKLTIKEITDKTKFNENAVRTYIHRLLKDKLIKQIGKKDRYCLYEAVDNKIQLDTQILIKMIPEFVKNEIEVDLENNELERVKELYAKI